MKLYCILSLLDDLKKGKRGAIAKAISVVENDPKNAKKLLKQIFKNSGNSIVIGITGPAGSGKSSLINKTVIALDRKSTRLNSSHVVISYAVFCLKKKTLCDKVQR